MAPAQKSWPAEGEVGDGNAWFRAIVSSSLDAIIGKRLDGTIISWNDAAERIYGYTAAEAIGQHISLIVPEDRRDEVNGILAVLPRGEGVRALETVRVRKNGTRINVSLTISPVRAASGEIIGGSVLARDITEIKHTQENLRVSRERLSVAVRAAEIGLFRWESASDQLEWDETMRSIFGIPDRRPMARLDDFLALVHPEDRESVAADARRSTRQGTEYTREYRIIRPDGKLRWIAAKARPFYDEEGKQTYLTGACRDVTDRRETQEALAAALDQKELLLREINHRVKNSLQLASSLLQVQGTSADSEDVRLALMEASSRLVTVARVHERLYQGAHAQAVDLGDYLGHLCGDIKGSTAAGGSRISTDVEQVAIGADKAILVGLIVNELVTNALKHAAPPGGTCEVRVQCRRSPSGLALAVSDTGQGLPRGFDIHGSASFGMRLLNAFARQLGGQLEAQSSSSGTRFALEIPVHNAKRP